MQTASAESAAVLDYASTRPREAVVRRLRKIVVVLIAVLLLGGAGFALQPTRYRASGLLSVPPTWSHPRDDKQEQLNLQAAQAAALAGLKSARTLDAAIGVLQQQGIPMTRREIAERMTVRPIEQSTLTYIAFDDAIAANAAAVLNAIMTSCGTPGVTIASPASLPPRPQRNHLYPIVGVIIGFFLGFAIVALRWK